VRLVAQHGDPVLGDSAQLSLAYSVTHWYPSVLDSGD
jgi:hypothetical protein